MLQICKIRQFLKSSRTSTNLSEGMIFFFFENPRITPVPENNA